MNKGRALTLCLIIVLLILSCNPPNDTRLLPIQLEHPRAEKLLSFYFGSFTATEGISPQDAGLLHIEEGAIHVDIEKLDALKLSQRLEDLNGDRVIDWEELEPFLINTYYEARNFPPTLELLYSQAGTPHPDSGWMDIELDGMMVSARRHVFTQLSAVQDALLAYNENDEQLLYPVGTTFVGHHFDNQQRIETTISQKRSDLFWDFFIYDQEGKLTSATQTGPKELLAPTRCVGCHFGTKLFEPEVSFPEEASRGPFGPRGIYVEDAAKNEEITLQLDEHAKRSDTVLGVYGTIYLSRLQSKREAGDALSKPEREILELLK